MSKYIVTVVNLPDSDESQNCWYGFKSVEFELFDWENLAFQYDCGVMKKFHAERQTTPKI